MRYSVSYLIIYIAISAVYLSKVLNEVVVNKFALYLIATILVTIFAIPFVKKMQKISRLSQEKSIFVEQANVVKTLASLGHEVSYDYSYSGINKDGANLRCRSLGFYLYPYYSNSDRDICVNIEEDQEGENINVHQQDMIVSNVAIDEVISNSDKYVCKVRFNVHHHYLNIDCNQK